MATKPGDSHEMKVLALNLSRTGTVSIKMALEQIECNKVYHGFNLIQEQQGPIWEEFLDRKYNTKKPITRADFERCLKNYDGAIEMPAAVFWEELMDAYPEAKVVLVERDVDEWFASFKATCLDPIYSTRSIFLSLVRGMGLIPQSERSFLKPVYLNYYRAIPASQAEKNCRDLFIWHYNSIAEKAEKEGRPYLRMRLEDGWEPLCKFLDKPIPNEPFPRINDRQMTTTHVDRETSRLVTQAGWAVVRRVALVSGLAGAAFYTWKRYSRN